VIQKKLKFGLLALSYLFLLAFNANAHHSSAAYDRETVLKISGVIQEFRWKNPHSHIKLEVSSEDENNIIWNFEGGGATTMVREGWRRSMLKIGDQVTIHYNPLRNGQPGGILQGADLADGQFMGHNY
ncbi:uncharacterized protein METZ01_LOCUS36558, partial [marine metagenome]